MATKSITSLGLGNADLTAIGKLSETGLSQQEVADAVVEGDKLKKGNKIVAYDGHLASTNNPHNTTANQVGAYTKAEVDGFVGAKLDKNTAIVGATKTKITYDSKGLVTYGADLIEADIPTLSQSKVSNLVTDLATKLDKNTNITGATKTKITYDSKGLVTGGADLAEVDLPNISQAKITNLVSDLSNKQDNLVSGTSIKTINGQTVLGSGNIIITGGDVDLTNYYDKTQTYNKVETDSLVDTKQDTLVSGTSIKTINGQTILGNGNIEITGGASLSNYYDKPQTETLLSNKVDKVTGKGLSTNDFTDTFKQAYDGHLASTSNPHNTTANQVGAYSKIEVDNLLANVDLTDYYDKTETETLLSNKVDKVTGKGLSTNDFTDTFKQALELKKVQDISTDSVTKKLVVNYTDATVANLNINDIITDVRVSGATLDATTNVLTLTSTDGGANVTVDLSDFVNSGELTSALSGKADKIHSHSTSDITGLDTTLSNKVTKNEAIIGATKTKITYDSNGLVTGGADLIEADLPNISQSKIINLETNLSSKIDKGVGVVGATKTKITYNTDGIITGGADLVEDDLPNISQSKITNLVSDLSNKQDNLVSGTNIKTINGQSVLGNGDIIITGGGSGGEVDLTNYYTKSETYNKVETDSLVDTKQDTLVSGTNIKTINGQSVLGNGDIEISDATTVKLTGNQTIAGVKTFSSDIVGNVTGNAGTTTKLQTARTINGVAFDGSTNITVSDDTAVKLTDNETIAGIKTFSSSIVGNITGNASLNLPLTGGTMTGAITAIREKKVAMAANNIDLATGNLFTKTITTATTLTVSNVLASGNANSFILELTNGGTGIITWWSGMKWAGGTAPTLTTAGVDILGFYSHDGGTTWRGMLMSKDSK